MTSRSGTTLRLGWFPAVGLFVLAFLVLATGANAQQLKITLGNEKSGPPDYATFRIGPLYSHFMFSESVGARYTEGTLGTIDFVSGTSRGAYRKNGIDFPLITDVSLRNYLQISKYMDMDITIWARYEYFPLETQDDVFMVNFTDPQLSTSLAWEFYPTRFLKLKLFERPAYIMTYTDQLGTEDMYGGLSYRRFENEAGVGADILLRSDMDVALTFSRFDVNSASRGFEDQEQIRYTFGAVYDYQLTPVFTTGLRAGYQSVDYAVSSRGDYASQSYEAFANAELSASSKLGAAVGYAVGTTAATNGVIGETEAGSMIGQVSFETEFWKDTVFQASYGRSVSPGFTYGAQTADSLKGLVRRTDVMGGSISLSSELANIDVAGNGATSYSDWINALKVIYPLTSGCDLDLLSSYSIRKVTPPTGVNTVGLPSELVNDYDTWINRAGVTMALMKELSLRTYVEYTLRSSTSSLLEYDRLNIGMSLTYVYEY